MTDYRNVEGLKVPFSVKVIQGGQDYATLSVTDYKMHLSLEDFLFEKPAN